MSDPFVAEIRVVGCNFAPRGWALCNGQIISLAQNTALFSLLGTTYGGDGRTNFALPDLQGRSPMAPGQGPGLSLYDLGQTGGSDTVTLISSQLPTHRHVLNGTAAGGNKSDPTGNIWATPGAARGLKAYDSQQGTATAMESGAVSQTGSSSPHNNLQPYLVLNFIIALQGVYPPRS